MEQTVLKESDKKAICDLFDRFLDTGFLNSGDYIFYNLLFFSGYLRPTNRELKKSLVEAAKYNTAKEQEKPPKQQKLYLYSGKSLMNVFRAKADIIELYFCRIDIDGKHIKEILNQKPLL